MKIFLEALTLINSFNFHDNHMGEVLFLRSLHGRISSRLRDRLKIMQLVSGRSRGCLKAALLSALSS